MITPSCYIDLRSTKGLKALAEEPFLPLAMAEASKFYRKQERGRFKFDDLLSVATEALLRVSIEARELEASKGKGVNYARKAIRGALLDHLRDYYKLVRNIEMTEAEYVRTQGDLAPERASAAIRRCYVYREAGESRFVRYTIYTPGPYRSNHQLLTGGGKVSSKHGMVSVPIGRASYKDGWNQIIGGQVHARVESDKQQEADPKHHKLAPGSMELLLNSEGKGRSGGRLPQVHKPPKDGVGQADYKGHGLKQRFSKTYFNGGEARRPNFDELSHVPMRAAKFWSRSGLKDERQFSFAELASRRGDGKATSSYKRIAQTGIRRCFVSPPLTTEEAVKQFGLRRSNAIVDMTKFGLDHGHGPKSNFPDLKLEGPKGGAIGWHREAGYFQVDCGVPDHGVFCRPVDGISLRPNQDPWRRGINIFSPAHKKFPEWGEAINEGGVPSRLAHGPAAPGGSCAGGAAPLPADDERLAHRPRRDDSPGGDLPHVAGFPPFYPLADSATA